MRVIVGMIVTTPHGPGEVVKIERFRHSIRYGILFENHRVPEYYYREELFNIKKPVK